MAVSLQKKREYWRNYYIKNKERRKISDKKYYENNKDKISKYAKEYRLKNKEKIALYMKEYYKNNKVEIILRSMKRDEERNTYSENDVVRVSE